MKRKNIRSNKQSKQTKCTRQAEENTERQRKIPETETKPQKIVIENKEREPRKDSSKHLKIAVESYRKRLGNNAKEYKKEEERQHQTCLVALALAGLA